LVASEIWALSPHTLLLVENDRAVHELLAAVLRHPDWRIDSAYDGRAHAGDGRSGTVAPHPGDPARGEGDGEAGEPFSPSAGVAGRYRSAFGESAMDQPAAALQDGDGRPADAVRARNEDGLFAARIAHAAIANPPGEPAKHLEIRAEQGVRPGGFGIMLTRNLVDELIYSEKGNEVLFIKYLK
jgi:hypothetical protein